MIESPVIWFTVLPLAGYLIGSIPFGVLIARAKGVDLRKVGSGNVGATNVARALGKRWGYTCFLLDLAKGFAPTFVTGYLIGAAHLATPSIAQQAAWLTVGAAAVAGHVWPVWLKFRGGKGVATSLGVVLGVWPFFTIPGLIVFAVWIAVTLASRYVSLGSVIGSLAFVPIFAILQGRHTMDLWCLGLFAVAGCRKALEYGLEPLPAILLGVLTAVGGGVARDLLVAETPRILHEEVYALAALVGATMIWLADSRGYDPFWSALIAVLAVFVIRVVSVWRGWRAPKAPGSP